MEDPIALLVLPGRLTDRTGGTIYDARVCRALGDAGTSAKVCEVQGAFPRPAPSDAEAATARIFAAAGDLPAGVPVVVDGLALGALPGLAGRLPGGRSLVGLIHHPLCDESPEVLDQELLERERRALDGVRGVIVTSRFTVERVRELALVRGEVPVRVVEPGVDVVPEVRMREPKPELRVLTVGSITPRKGYGDLALALGGLAELPVLWRAVGSTDRDPICAAALGEIGGPVELLGEVDDATLHAEFAAADLFVHPARYEGFGMVVPEALAHGVPVISSTGGALVHTAARPGVTTFPPGNVEALAACLRTFITDEGVAGSLRAAAFEAAAPGNVRTWDRVAEEFARALRAIA